HADGKEGQALACRRGARRAGGRALGRSDARRQESRRKPAATPARRASRRAYHRDPQFDLSAACRARAGEGRRGRQDPPPLPMSPRALAALALVAVLAGCSAQPLRDLLQGSKGAASLAVGLREYENGDYAEAARNLQGALDLGLTDSERANARKHLAFIDCASGRERACREEFRKAL